MTAPKFFSIRKESGKQHIFYADKIENDVATSLCGLVDRRNTVAMEGFARLSYDDLFEVCSNDSSNNSICMLCKKLT